MELTDMRPEGHDPHGRVSLSTAQLKTLLGLAEENGYTEVGPSQEGLMIVDLGKESNSICSTVEIVVNEGSENQQNWIMAWDGELVEPTSEWLAERGLIERA